MTFCVAMEASNNTAFQVDAQGRTTLRPLLPALSPDPAHDSPMLKGMVRRTGIPARAACHACRRRKSRCSGGRPRCTSCQARNVDCVYDTASKGETRVQALKRKFVELNEQQSSHRRVYELLATLPLPEARALFERLRQTDGADNLLRLVNDGDLLLQLKLTPESRSRYEFPFRREMPATVMEFDNPYLNSLVYECSLRNTGTHDSLETIDVAFEAYRDLYLKPFHAATVVDRLLDAVEPSRWTSVSKDDALMRKIMAAYFMNEYPSLPAFHKDYFLRDMAEGRHRFCSRLLVNAVLAMGCICYSGLPSRYEHWNPQSLVYQFMGEAKRLWGLETDKLKLTTVQAGPILNIIHNMCCQDKLGWAFTMQAVTMAHSLGLFSPAASSPSSRQYSKREQDARDFTAWCIFTFQTLHCLLLFDCPLMLKPPDIPLPDPAEDPEWYSEVWLRYPTRDRLCPVSFGYLFRARAGIRIITNDILLACCGDHAPIRHLSIEQASMFSYRLETWYNALPRVLNAKKSVLPSHLLLHINYQNVLINLHGPFLQDGPFADGYDPYLSREAALMRLETLLRMYYLRHGFEFADAFVIQPLSLMAFENLEKLKADPYGPKSDAIRSSLILAAKGLWDQGQSCYVSRTTLCLLRTRIQQAELHETELKTLDREVNIVLKPDAAECLQIRNVRARWPPSLASLTEDPESQRLSALVERYMRIEGESDSESEDDVDREDYMDDDGNQCDVVGDERTRAMLGRSPGTMTASTTTQAVTPS
ncbi:DNA binding [Microdochium nivale]|nr:DNA binding [Microdochium nivale]